MRSSLPSAARLLMLTIRPKPASRIAGSTASAHWMATRTLRSITASRSAAVCSSTGAGRTIPTLLTSRVTARSLLEMLSAAWALHPAFGEAEVVEVGVDARPAFRDNLPRIRRRDGTVYLNGLFRHGFLLAPAMARMAADLATEGRRPEVMDEDHPEVVE